MQGVKERGSEQSRSCMEGLLVMCGYEAFFIGISNLQCVGSSRHLSSALIAWSSINCNIYVDPSESKI